ncbi:non-canonical purine NTP pyrophosphatase [Furfurilactobacillus curtus]|uniref:Non-canonical purine NTP pyrophosphatase n=1 Tax=Furfurilactobacillus curtus TaxID=1746200 RepID=A0ABQ5JP75_9LACO
MAKSTKPLLVAATNNPFKFAELARTFTASGYSLQPYWQYLGRQHFPTEGTKNFTDNATGKAEFIAKQLPEAIVIGDDSGLFIDALPDHFGVTTIRELNEHAKTDAQMNQYIIDLLAPTQASRQARLTTTLTVVTPNGSSFSRTGWTTFTIPFQPIGLYSHGFDRIMWLPEIGLTLAQLPDQARIPFTPRGRVVPQVIHELVLRDDFK